ncbi:hypothetical protein [Pseudomonas petrae]|uniref:HNH endonuclease n=1 Tax=Pseudomonas petrae TaxID=2912190 RepID=A0ABS9IC55_9PSED|nr:hypothetical protein [Pseudomonas petrae]MCF7545295.1 hypothetical protein [Pseudomonas petrae]
MAQDETEYRVDLDKLNAFLKEKTTTEACPFCGTVDWTLPVAGDVTVNSLPWGKVDGNMYMAGLPVLTLVCKSCFFVRMMSLADQDIRAKLAEVPRA